jgi:hypothetical protein
VSLDAAHPMLLDAGHAASSTCHVGPDCYAAVAADLRVRWLFTAIVLLTLSPDSQGARHVSELRAPLDLLTPAERRDLANALLRAAWSAALEETRILLLDLLLNAEDTIHTDIR